MAENTAEALSRVSVDAYNAELRTSEGFTNRTQVDDT